jgi:hypothetical protein
MSMELAPARMTRRSLFATLAAAIAGRKSLPAAEPPSFATALAQMDPLALERLMPSLDARTYVHMQYGLGFTVKAELIPDYLTDRATWFLTAPVPTDVQSLAHTASSAVRSDQPSQA